MSLRVIQLSIPASRPPAHSVFRILGSVRCSSTTTNVKQKKRIRSRMKAWQIYQYGGNDELSLSTTTKVPSIQNHKDILVEVHAASVNPIDTLMRGGYGRNLLNAMRTGLGATSPPPEFPRTLGRDFSGTVVAAGLGVSRFKPGDEVWGAIDGHKQGTHAQYTIAGEEEISHKPESVSHVEAAAIPYVAATTWKALYDLGGLTEKTSCNKRVLIHGGSGGIGTFAIQLMKHFGANVTSTCSTDAVGLVTSLGADTVIDYKTSDVPNELKKLEKFDAVLDTIGGDAPSFSLDVLKTWSNATYVSLLTPLLGATDRYGLPGGLVMAGSDLGMNMLKGFSQGRSYRWGLFRPNGNALRAITKMVNSKQIRPVIDEVYDFDQVPKAFAKVEQKHGRGKTVIDMTS